MIWQNFCKKIVVLKFRNFHSTEKSTFSFSFFLHAQLPAMIFGYRISRLRKKSLAVFRQFDELLGQFRNICFYYSQSVISRKIDILPRHFRKIELFAKSIGLPNLAFSTSMSCLSNCKFYFLKTAHVVSSIYYFDICNNGMHLDGLNTLRFISSKVRIQQCYQLCWFKS